MMRTSIGLFVVVAALWGLPYALISVALDHGAGPFMIAWARVASGALLLLALAAFLGRPGAFRDHPWTVAAVAVFDIAVPFTALSVAEQHVSSSMAGILIATTPLFVGVMAALLLPAERPSKRGWAGLIIGFAGVVGLFGAGVEGSAAAAVLVLVAAGSYAAASLLVNARLAGADSLSLGAAALAVAAIVLAPGAVLEREAGRADATAWAAIAVLGVLCTAAAFALYYELIARAGATRAALTTYFSPLLSVSIGALVLGDTLLKSAAAGLALILAGSWLTR
jgi:drug/metabolite transporter (DMT)-like permease